MATRKLCDARRELAGVMPWLDKKRLLPGQDWEEASWAALVLVSATTIRCEACEAARWERYALCGKGNSHDEHV